MMKFNFDIKTIPEQNGIYIWKDDDQKILYVGKAKNIKKRIMQYMNGGLNSFKTKKMLQRATFLDFSICSNEKEALILEQQLIKEHKPFYNILLLDDKKYPFINIKLKSNGLSISKQYMYKKSKNNFSFGPIPTGFGSKIIMDLLVRESLYQNGLPIKNKSLSFWEEKFENCKKILSANNSDFIKKLNNQMQEASMNMQYELAAEIRDQINYLSKNNQKQSILINSKETIWDLIVFYPFENFLLIGVQYFRNGSMFMQEDFVLEKFLDDFETAQSFLNQFYEARMKPQKIISNFEINQHNLVSLPKIIVPQKGVYKQAIDNLKNNLDSNKEIKILEFEKNALVFEKIKLFTEQICQTPINNFIIIDNSNLADEAIVSAILYYENWQPIQSKFRKFNISQPTKLGDANYMYEGLKKYIETKNTIPDLIIVDGSTHQIKKAKEIRKEYNLNFQIIGLVKNENHKTDHLLTEEGKRIKFFDTQIFNYFSNLQIQVDRYAKHHHNKKHLKSSLEGFLSTIEGIGPKTEEKLLKHFKTYANIYNSSQDELEAIVSKKISQKIIEKIEKME